MDILFIIDSQMIFNILRFLQQLAFKLLNDISDVLDVLPVC